MVEEENKIAVELNALKDLHDTAMSIANHIKMHTDKPSMSTAADESLLTFE